jgi:hypothetical protein
MRRLLLSLALVLALAGSVCAPMVLAAATVTPVATGLDNPRGLAFGPGGRL